jgi:hypothetical protein
MAGVRKTILVCFGATLLAAGCVGGFPDDRPQPGRPWAGPRHSPLLPATRPFRDVAPGDYDSAVGITRASPERIMACARALLEPAYGHAKYVRRDIPNGRTRHWLLTPRYGVANRGRDFRWLEVSVNFDPCDGRSIVEVEEVRRSERLVGFPLHGLGFWLFPTDMTPCKGPGEHELLVAILQSLGDDGAYITTWGQAP